MFDRYILPWYEMSEDPKRFAEWCARCHDPALPPTIVAIAAALLAGDNDRAVSFIQDKLSELERPFEEFLAEEEECRPTKGWRGWIHGGARIPGQNSNEENALLKQKGCQEAAHDARVLAKEFGLSI